MPENLPRLRTSRLLLRAPHEADAGFVYDMYSRAEVMRHIGHGRPDTSMTQARERIQRYRAQFSADAYGGLCGVWLVTSGVTDPTGGLPHGFALLKPIPFSEGVDGHRSEPDIEIGWHLHPDSWGRGFASEAGRALVARARSAGLTTLVAVTHADNAASQAVARRLGMIHRGSTDRYYNTTCELFTLELGEM